MRRLPARFRQFSWKAAAVACVALAGALLCLTLRLRGGSDSDAAQAGDGSALAAATSWAEEGAHPLALHQSLRVAPAADHGLVLFPDASPGDVELVARAHRCVQQLGRWALQVASYVPLSLDVGQAGEPPVELPLDAFNADFDHTGWIEDARTLSTQCKETLKNATHVCHADMSVLWETKLGLAIMVASFVITSVVVALTILCVCCCSLRMSYKSGAKAKPRPPRYWKNRPCNPFKDRYYEEVDVTAELKDIMQHLLDLTTEPSKMGRGRDGEWAQHKRFRVYKVTRIENGEEWSKYVRMRLSIPKMQALRKEMTLEMKDRTAMALEIIERHFARFHSDVDLRIFFKQLQLDSARNERMLFHGSKNAGALDNFDREVFPTEECSPAYAIKRQGFENRLGEAQGMYGAGTYFADMSCKADQYAGRYHSRDAEGGSVGERSTMFLSRVTLGSPYLTDQSLERLRRPPCVEGTFDLNLSWIVDQLVGKPWGEKGFEFRVTQKPRFDSVMQDFEVDGMVKLFREYVVYQKQAYPEFCIYYERCRE